MAERDTQEKMTFNINIMELAKIDYLISKGFYSNRSDFLRTALRNQLTVHNIFVSDEVVQEELTARDAVGRSSFRALGIFHISRDDLISRSIAVNKKVDILVFGSLIIDKAIDLDLFKKAVNSIRVFGVLKGPADVVKYIKSLSN